MSPVGLAYGSRLSGLYPVGVTTIEAPGLVGLGWADRTARRILFIRPGHGASESDAQRLFSTSILISATRCLLTYVAFPIVTPLVGALTGVAPIIGLPIAVLALVFDVLGIRRFFLAAHRLRWPVTAVYLAVMGLVSYLLAGDIAHFV